MARIRRTSWASALVLALGLGACQNQGACRLGLATVVPLTFASGGRALQVPVGIGDGTLMLELDTGAARTLVNDAALTKQQRQITGITGLSGVGGGGYFPVADIIGLSLGRLRGGISASLFRMDPPRGKQRFDGLLGSDILSNYDVDLDIQGGELRLYKAQGDCRQLAVALDGPLYGAAEERRHPLDVQKPVVAVTIGGQTLRAVIDTGSVSTAMFRQAAERIGLNAAALSHDPNSIAQGIGPATVAARLHMIDRVTIGSLSLRHVPVTIIDQQMTDIDMMLGMDFIRRVHLWISNSSHTIVMQVPPAPSPPLPAVN